MPINLDVSAEFAAGLELGMDIALRDEEGVILAILHLQDIYTPDKKHEAMQVYGTTDPAHSGVNYLFNKAGSVYLGRTNNGDRTGNAL